MLTEAIIKKAVVPEESGHVRLTDAGSLYLEVSAASKRWFYRFRFAGKDRRLALSSWPKVSLKDARTARDKARDLVQQGIDPVYKRRQEKLANKVNTADTFEATAREFLKAKRSGWSEPHAKRWIERLEHDVFPWIGADSLKSITPPALLQVLRRVESRGVHETVHSIHQSCGQVFRYGIAVGRCMSNPGRDLSEALAPVNVKHMAAITEPKEFGDLLRAIADYQGGPVTRAALLVSALTFQRPGNVRAAEWSEIDLDGAMWTIPAQKMKLSRYGKDNAKPHRVPLAPQAVAVLRDLQPLTGHGKYVFPSLQGQGRCMSENTVNVALRRLGFGKDVMTAHGFRASARTLIIEKLDVAEDVIEAQLAHGKSGPLGSAYDRAEFMEQRRQMMTAWADYCDKLRAGAMVIAFPRAS